MKVILILLCLVMGGCAALDTVKSKGAEMSDAMIESSLWNICYAASVGSVRRKFNTPDDIRRYNELCKGVDNAVLEPLD